MRGWEDGMEPTPHHLGPITDNIAFYLEIQFWQHFILSQNSVAAVMTMEIVLSS
jgi:hypothetical protein